jgi:ribonuclease HI
MRRVHICSNSRAALAALTKATTESALIWECMQALGKLSESNNITLIWILWHQGILGNEEVDRLAKGVPPSQAVVIPFTIER